LTRPFSVLVGKSQCALDIVLVPLEKKQERLLLCHYLQVIKQIIYYLGSNLTKKRKLEKKKIGIVTGT
jgi:hypothetical protein